MKKLFAAGLFLIVFVQPAMAIKFVDGQVILAKIDEYQTCQSKDYSGQWCQEALERWVKDHPGDAFKAGKLTRQKMNHWAAIPFFSQAFAEKKGDCGDVDVRMAVVSAINLPPQSNSEIVEKAKKIGVEICFPQMREAIAEVATIDSYAFANVCKILIVKDALTGLKQKKCIELH